MQQTIYKKYQHSLEYREQKGQDKCRTYIKIHIFGSVDFAPGTSHFENRNWNSCWFVRYIFLNLLKGNHQFLNVFQELVFG